MWYYLLNLHESTLHFKAALIKLQGYVREVTTYLSLCSARRQDDKRL